MELMTNTFDYTKITWRGKKFDEEELNEKLNTIKRAEYIFSNWEWFKTNQNFSFLCINNTIRFYGLSIFLEKILKLSLFIVNQKLIEVMPYQSLRQKKLI